MTVDRKYAIVPEIGTEPWSGRDSLDLYRPGATAQPPGDHRSARERESLMNLLSDSAPRSPAESARPPVPRAPKFTGFSTRWVLAAVLCAIAALAAVVYLSLDDPARLVGAGGGDSGSDVSPATSEVVQLADERAGYWTVTGVPDTLNVRDTPGLAGQLVTTLPATMTGIYATGRRASVDGLEWKQILVGDDSSASWVAAQYLTPDGDTVSSVVVGSGG